MGLKGGKKAWAQLFRAACFLFCLFSFFLSPDVFVDEMWLSTQIIIISELPTALASTAGVAIGTSSNGTKCEVAEGAWQPTNLATLPFLSTSTFCSRRAHTSMKWPSLEEDESDQIS